MLKFTFPIHAISHIHLTKNNNIEIYRKQQNDKYWSTLMTFREDNVIKNKLFESKWYKWRIEGFFGKKNYRQNMWNGKEKGNSVLKE